MPLDAASLTCWKFFSGYWDGLPLLLGYCTLYCVSWGCDCPSLWFDNLRSGTWCPSRSLQVSNFDLTQYDGSSIWLGPVNHIKPMLRNLWVARCGNSGIAEGGDSWPNWSWNFQSFFKFMSKVMLNLWWISWILKITNSALNLELNVSVWHSITQKIWLD